MHYDLNSAAGIWRDNQSFLSLHYGDLRNPYQHSDAWTKEAKLELCQVTRILFLNGAFFSYYQKFFLNSDSSPFYYFAII